MKTIPTALLTAGSWLALTQATFANVRYVDVNSARPMPPYTNWATAATIIQQAVDAAAPGDEILVTNGVYQTGGRAVAGTMTNRVEVDKPVTLRSANGPQVTIIRGYQVPGTTNGDGAIRCVYLTNRATLSGFTLTNGATRNASGDAVYLTEQSGGGVWCEPGTAMVSNCVMTGNSASSVGGGSYAGTLNNCTLTGNSAQEKGGGMFGGILNNCRLTGNSARLGGGAIGDDYNARPCTLNNCTLTGNSASYGGGAFDSTLNNCTLTGNSAQEKGGGALGGTLNNCTLTGNSAGVSGGGASGYSFCIPFGGGCSTVLVELSNCIVYFNSAPDGPNYGSYSSLNFCCTSPQPSNGTGNIAADPQLASASHLSVASPCRGAGDAASARGTDIDGEVWANPPSIGCDEFHAGAVGGPLAVSIVAAFTNVSTGFTVNFTGIVLGPALSNRWEFGDGTTLGSKSYEPFTSHSWTSAGDYAVVLRAYNDDHPGGVSAIVTIHVVAQPVHYVAANGSNPTSPFTSWATAATNIQDAVDAATVPGALVLKQAHYD